MEKLQNLIKGRENLVIGCATAFVACNLVRICFRSKNTPKILSPTATGRIRGILITGGASGIGLRTTVKFLLEGWKVGVYDLNISDLEKKICDIEPDLAELLKERLFSQQLDVTDTDSCKSAIDHFTKNNGGYIDALFNCAGILYAGPFEKGSLAKQRALIRVNCEGVLQMSYLALDSLKKTDNSCIVSMASISAMGSIANHGVYCSTKAFVWSLTGALRGELKCHNVRVCDVSVSFVDTPMVQTQNINNYTPQMQKDLKKIKPKEVANTVFRAVHESNFNTVHFYVRYQEKLTFRLFKVVEALFPSVANKIFDDMFLLDFQKK